MLNSLFTSSDTTQDPRATATGASSNPGGTLFYDRMKPRTAPASSERTE